MYDCLNLCAGMCASPRPSLVRGRYMVDQKAASTVFRNFFADFFTAECPCDWELPLLAPERGIRDRKGSEVHPLGDQWGLGTEVVGAVGSKQPLAVVLKCVWPGSGGSGLKIRCAGWRGPGDRTILGQYTKPFTTRGRPAFTGGARGGCTWVDVHTNTFHGCLNRLHHRTRAPELNLIPPSNPLLESWDHQTRPPRAQEL